MLEVDEAFGPGLAKRLVPHSVLLINVQVDQLNRFYEPDRVVGMLESFAGVATRHLVVNADDHNLVDLAHRLAERGAELSAFALAPELLAESAWLARGDNPALAEAGPAAPDAQTRVTAASGATATIEVDGVAVDVDAARPRTAQRRRCRGGLRDGARSAGRPVRPRDRGSRPRAGMETVFGRGEVHRARPTAKSSRSS